MKKNLIYIMLANIVYLILVAGTNFILPKFTTIETYAAIKEYTLYLTTYSSISTFGYIQGVYLKYGGVKLKKIESADIGRSLVSFFCFMLPISVCIGAIGFFQHNYIIIALGCGLFASNVATYYQTLYQATGAFKEYGTALNTSRIMMLLIYVILIFVLRTDNTVLFIAAAPVVSVVNMLYLTFRLNKRLPLFKDAKPSIGEMRLNIKRGFVLMLGDFVTRFFSTIDRWFVKLLMETIHFALYSFATSMENLVNTFMTPITVSMYNYFCRKPSNEDVKKIKRAALVYAFAVIAAAYPLKWILENFMKNYIGATQIMFPLFAAQGISTIVKGIFINKYKAENKQNKYLFQIIAMVLLSIVLNIVLYFIMRNIAGIAIATLITNIVWLIVCEMGAKEIRYDIKSIITIVILLLTYMITGYTLNSVLGCIIYCAMGLMLGFTLMKESFMYVIGSFFGKIAEKFRTWGEKRG